MGFLKNMAKFYSTPRTDMTEMLSVVVIGFIKGIEAFDINKGYRITSYAKWHILKECMSQRASELMICIPQDMRKRYTKIKKMASVNGRSPKQEWLATKDYRKPLKFNFNILEVHYTAIKDEVQGLQMAYGHPLEKLLEKIENLPELFKTVVKLYIENKTYQEIGKVIGKSKDYARVRLLKAIEMLKKLMEDENIPAECFAMNF